MRIIMNFRGENSIIPTVYGDINLHKRHTAGYETTESRKV